VGDRSPDLQDPVVRPGGKTERCHRHSQQFSPCSIEPAVLTHVHRSQVGTGIEAIATREPLHTVHPGDACSPPSISHR
jgi:hypothetical protein